MSGYEETSANNGVTYEMSVPRRSVHADNKDNDDDDRVDIQVKLESKRTDHWGNRLHCFIEQFGVDEGLQQIQTVLKEDAAAWGVFAALLMTVGFAGLTISADDFVLDADEWKATTACYVGGNTISAAFSFLACLIGTYRYVFFNGLPYKMMDRALARNTLMHGLPFIILAMLAQCVGALCGVWLLFGELHGQVSMYVMIFTFLVWIAIQIVQVRSVNAMDIGNVVMFKAGSLKKKIPVSSDE